MSLPVIVTNHSGPTAFCFDNNSYLLRLQSPPNEFDDLSFANPSEEHLTYLMRQVIEDSSTFVDVVVNGSSNAVKYSIAQLKGKEAKKTMEFFSPEYVVGMIQDRLKYHASRRGWTF